MCCFMKRAATLLSFYGPSLSVRTANPHFGQATHASKQHVVAAKCGFALCRAMASLLGAQAGQQPQAGCLLKFFRVYSDASAGEPS